MKPKTPSSPSSVHQTEEVIVKPPQPNYISYTTYSVWLSSVSLPYWHELNELNANYYKRMKSSPSNRHCHNKRRNLLTGQRCDKNCTNWIFLALFNQLKECVMYTVTVFWQTTFFFLALEFIKRSHPRYSLLLLCCWRRTRTSWARILSPWFN